jgi:hypothetical protein
MRKRQKSASALTIEHELASIRERCLSDGALEHFWRSHPLFDCAKANEKFNKHRDRFIRRADPEQRKHVNKLWRFHQAAKYGPALSKSWKRTRRAFLFNALRKIVSLLEPPAGFPPPDLPQAAKSLTAIFRAAEKDDEFWTDAPIAAKLTKTRSDVNWFLAEYSWSMIGRRPLLSFSDLHKILPWIESKDLRRQIGRIRKEYGPLTVPLKPGRPGRPRKN